MKNKEIGNTNQNFGRNSSSQQNNLISQMKYQNINQNYQNSTIQNNLINTGFEYKNDFSNQKMNEQYIQQNNFINNTKDTNPNNNIINNNLIYQDYNKQNIYNDPKKKKQEEYKRMLDQQRKQDFEIREKMREISYNNNLINNNINMKMNDINNKVITRPQMNEEERARYKKKQM